MSIMVFLSLIFGGFIVICGAISGEQNKDVILLCSFTPGSEETIHWNTKNNKNVHSYYYSKDQLQNQDKDYTGRTSLFLNEISKGNASLLIRNLKKSDENTYNCYVGTKEGKTEYNIILQVIDAISGEENNDVILPCSFTPAGEETIHWNTGNKKNVHSYYYSEDQLQNQDKDYTGRTSLFLNEINNGNASLLIRNLKKSDENTYNCYVGTKEGKTENEIILHVIDLQHKMEYKWDNGPLRLTCSVKDCSGEDITVKWYENGQLVHEEKSCKSSYTVKNNSSTYECTLDNSNVKSKWTGTWRWKEPIKKKDDILTCGCDFCKATNPDFSIKLNLREGTNEETIASMDNSSFNVTTYHRNKIVQDGERNMKLSNFSTNDSDLYVCLITSKQKISIEMTLVNITVENDTHVNRNRTYLLPLISFSCIFIIFLFLFLLLNHQLELIPKPPPDVNDQTHNQEGLTDEQPDE